VAGNVSIEQLSIISDSIGTPQIPHSRRRGPVRFA